jgi:aryl-alcohol dehydrogenase-like predicted oxidoreductase
LGNVLSTYDRRDEVRVTTKVGRVVISEQQALRDYDAEDPCIERGGASRSVYFCEKTSYCKFDYSKKGFEKVLIRFCRRIRHSLNLTESHSIRYTVY